MRRVIIRVDMGKYKTVELDLEAAENLLSEIVKRKGEEPQDVSETLRILRSFDAFYETARKKYMDYIVPSKSMNDMILGRVIVDKVKLVKEGDHRRVVLILDRRVPVETIVESLRALGMESEVRKVGMF